MTMPTYTFRISPADPCLIEWRRNQRGREPASGCWLYWHRSLNPQDAQEALLAIAQVGFTIEREHPEGSRL